MSKIQGMGWKGGAYIGCKLYEKLVTRVYKRYVLDKSETLEPCGKVWASELALSWHDEF